MQWIATVALVVMGALTWRVEAHAFGCQGSGSFPLFPSSGTTCPTALRVGDTFDVAITVNNTSTSVPPGTNVTAKLVNVCVAGANNGAECTVSSDCESETCGAALDYTLACVQTFCATELPGVLTFVPVGSTGCVASVPGVATCGQSPTSANRVEIRVDPDGVALAAGAMAAPLATIRVAVTAPLPALPNPCNQFATRVDASGNSIVTTDDRCDAVATGGAAGSQILQMASPSQCSAAPRDGCREPVAPMESRLALEDDEPDSRDRLTWRWRRGASTPKADFGDPLTTTGYRLCVYDETAATPSLVASAEVPAGGTCGNRPCWDETKRGFAYGNKAATPAGVVRLDLRDGAAGKAMITLEARGTNLAMPTLPLPQDPTVTVQLQNDDGQCWGARYTAPAIVNDASEFRDRSE